MTSPEISGTSPNEDSGLPENSDVQHIPVPAVGPEWDDFDKAVRDFHRVREAVNTLTGPTLVHGSDEEENQRATRHRFLQDHYRSLAKAYGKLVKANNGRAVRPMLRKEAIKKLVDINTLREEDAKAAKLKD